MNQADKIIADCQQKSNKYLAPEFKNFYHIGQLQHHIIDRFVLIVSQEFLR
jgi:hypothetical protein